MVTVMGLGETQRRAVSGVIALLNLLAVFVVVYPVDEQSLGSVFFGLLLAAFNGLSCVWQMLLACGFDPLVEPGEGP